MKALRQSFLAQPLGLAALIFFGAIAGRSLLAQAPAITQQPLSQTNRYEWVSTTFSVAACGAEPLQYQWRHNGTNIAEASANTLLLSNVWTNDAGLYDIVVANRFGSATSQVAALTVIRTIADTVIVTSFTTNGLNDCPPMCLGPGAWSTSGSTEITSVPGVPARSRTVYASGGTPVWTVQPQLTGTSIYRIQVAHNSGAGSTTSCSTNVVVGLSASGGALSPSCNSTPVFQRTYGGPVWNTIGFITNDLKSPVITFSYISGTLDVIANRLYTDAFKFESPGTQVVVGVAPVTTDPQNQTIRPGDVALLSTIGCGTDPLNYQWIKNGAPIAGAESATLSISNAQATDAGTYQVIVTNSFGGVTSAVAIMTVLEAPWFSALERNTSGPTTLSVRGVAGHICDLYWSSNLLQWDWLMAMTNVTGQASCIDTSCSNVPVRFYKAIQQP